MNRTGKKSQTQDRARRAVTEFRKLQPTLTAYARNLTGKPNVRVEMSATDNGSTDGTKIYFKPPIRLGDMAAQRHEKSLCDKRDPETLELYCVACRMREGILAIIYHEIAHIAFDSFAQTTMADAKFALGIVKAIAPDWYYQRLAEKFVKSPTVLYGKKTFPELAQAINPYFKFLVNALEDVRINERMADARPGTRIMQDAKMLQVANNGVEQKDETGKTVWLYWNEYPTNHQAVLGALCVASGYMDLIDGWFEPRVVEAVRDPKMVSLLDEVKTLTGAQQVFEHSFKVYMRFRDLGFFMLKDEEPPPAEPEPEESDTDELADGDDGSDGPDGGSDEPDDAGEGDAGESAPDTGDGGEGTDGSDESDADGGGSEDHGGDEDSRSGSASSDPDGMGSDDAGESDADGEPSGDRGSAGGGQSSDNEGDESSDDRGESSGDDGEADATDDEDADGSDPVGEGSGDRPEDAGDGDEGSESGPDAHGSDEANGDGSVSDAEPEAADVEADDDSDAGAGDGAGEGEPSEGDSVDGPDERTSEGSGGVGEEDQGGDPLDYKPEAESAIDLTDRESAEPIEPTIGSDEEIELIDLGLHPEVDEAGDVSPEMDKAIDTAIIQSIYFEMPSQNISGLNVWKYATYRDDAANRPWHAWGGDRYSSGYASRRGQTIDPVGESVLGPALMRMRVVFSDNKRSHRNRNMRSGKIDTRALGKRGWSGDDRLFGRRVNPSKKDYFVGIFLDISGSTNGVNIKMIKEAALAQAELCHRMGIAFAVYGHTGSPANLTDYADGLSVDLYEVKAPEQAWDNKAREALMELNPSAANLDGHTMEFARKLADAQPQTDKVILYYSDGAMPLENHNEELEILQREIATCRAKGYTLLGVGVRTDSPARHGLETVQIDDSDEVAKVVSHLERHLVS